MPVLPARSRRLTHRADGTASVQYLQRVTSDGRLLTPAFVALPRAPRGSRAAGAQDTDASVTSWMRGHGLAASSS